MTHKDWCGEKCSECSKSCGLDESIQCSPDCEKLGAGGETMTEECFKCDAIEHTLFDRIADYIIKNTQEESNPDMSGFQLITGFNIIQELFALEIEQFIQEKIIESLFEREEVADALVDSDGYDIVLYTSFAPNYIPENYE